MSWWFKRHPELLTRECQKLNSNSNYKEYLRSRINLLVSVGEIIVRLNETYKYPIIIIYPESTPYKLPYVIPLTSLLNKDELNEVSSNTSQKAIKIINDKNKVKYLNFWHQNTDGTICLLEADNLEKYGEFFSVKEVINRTRDWLAGIKTGKLPMDSPEVEIYVHFRNKELSKEILVPPIFLQKKLYQGEFYCIHMTTTYSNIDNLKKDYYLGTVITGVNRNGIQIDSDVYSDLSSLLPKGFNSFIDLIAKRELLERKISEGKIIEGFWWNTNKNINLIQTINDFAEEIGEGDIENGFNRLQELIGDFIFKQRPVIIAIRFLNKKNELQWQTFILKRDQAIVIPNVGNHSQIEFKELITNNYKLCAIRNSEFSENKHHLRNTKRANRNILKEKTVNVIGCGALGSEFSDTIGKAGIGNIVLIDYERLDIENSIRHVLGINNMGIFKIDGLRQHIKNHNPFVNIELKLHDVTNGTINDYFIDAGVGVSTIGDDNVEGFLNEQALINKKVMFYCRALRGGKAARIFRVIPGEDACFYCLNLFSDERNENFIKINADDNLPTITNECNNPIRPSSAADLKLISSFLSQIVLDYFQDASQPNNHWIWSKESLNNDSNTNIPANQLIESNIPPHQNCPYCRQPTKLSVNVKEEILEFMKQEISINNEVETGGILLGEFNNNSVLVNYASGPGPKAIKEKSKFLKDKEYCQKFIDKKYMQHRDIASYIGEWHYHPSTSNKPSNRDLKSLSNIANGQGYLTENPIMIILSNEGKASCTVHPARNPYYYVDLKKK